MLRLERKSEESLGVSTGGRGEKMELAPGLEWTGEVEGKSPVTRRAGGSAWSPGHSNSEAGRGRLDGLVVVD